MSESTPSTPVGTDLFGQPAVDRDVRLSQLWSTHESAEEEITRLSIAAIADLIKEAFPDDKVIGFDCEWVESASWTVSLEDTQDIAAVGTKGVRIEEAYDTTLPDGRNLADEIASYVPWIWESYPSLLRPYALEYTVDRQSGELDTARFDLERAYTPWTKEQLEARDREAAEQRRREREEWMASNRVNMPRDA